MQIQTLVGFMLKTIMQRHQVKFTFKFTVGQDKATKIEFKEV
jgi:hypothetical protein